LLQFKNGLENDHKVALTFYGNKHRVRVFRRAEDLKERVANFYDNMNEFYLNLDKELGEFDKLGQAVRRMMSIVSEAIGSPSFLKTSRIAPISASCVCPAVRPCLP
jgi:hypothetical protein